MMVDKVFCKPVVGSSGRSIARKESKFVYRVSVYSSKNKTLLHQGLSVGLCSWQIGHSVVATARSPWWVEARVAAPMPDRLPATIATLFMSPLGDDRVSFWGKRRTGIHRTGHTIHFIIKILFC